MTSGWVEHEHMLLEDEYASFRRRRAANPAGAEDTDPDPEGSGDGLPEPAAG